MFVKVLYTLYMNKMINNELNKIKNLDKLIEIIFNGIKENKKEIATTNFATTTRTSEEISSGMSIEVILLDETMQKIKENKLLNTNNLINISINKSLDIVELALENILRIKYNSHMWGLLRIILEYTLVFRLMINEEISKIKFKNLAIKMSEYEANKNMEHPRGLFGIFSEKINITNKMSALEKDMTTLYATLSARIHPSLLLNDLSSSERSAAIEYFRALYNLSLLLFVEIKTLSNSAALKWK